MTTNETVLFECVPSRLEPWPVAPAIVASEFTEEIRLEHMWLPTPTEDHFAEVLDLNPALKGWGEPL